MTIQERYNQMIEQGDFEGAETLMRREVEEVAPGVYQRYIAAVDPVGHTPVMITSVSETDESGQSLVERMRPYQMDYNEAMARLQSVMERAPQRQTVIQTNEAGMRVFNEAVQRWAEHTLNSPEMTRFAEELEQDERRAMWGVGTGVHIPRMPVPGNAVNQNTPNITESPQVQTIEVSDVDSAIKWMLDEDRV